jgi:hypothetical protein
MAERVLPLRPREPAVEVGSFGNSGVDCVWVLCAETAGLASGQFFHGGNEHREATIMATVICSNCGAKNDTLNTPDYCVVCKTALPAQHAGSQVPSMSQHVLRVSQSTSALVIRRKRLTWKDIAKTIGMLLIMPPLAINVIASGLHLFLRVPMELGAEIGTIVVLAIVAIVNCFNGNGTTRPHGEVTASSAP